MGTFMLFCSLPLPSIPVFFSLITYISLFSIHLALPPFPSPSIEVIFYVQLTQFLFQERLIICLKTSEKVSDTYMLTRDGIIAARKNLSILFHMHMSVNDCVCMCVWEEGIAILIKIPLFSLSWSPANYTSPYHILICA